MPASFPSAIPGRYQCINEQDLAGGCLKFLMDNILFFESEQIPTIAPKEACDALNEVAGRIPAGSDRLIFTPWLNGERTIESRIFNITQLMIKFQLLKKRC